MIADYIVADSYLLARLRRDIADDIIAGLFILFDVDSEHEDHSAERLFFVGYIVNFVVSSLICMFQDSVPAGSYNDPFLSSVWEVILFSCDARLGGSNVNVCKRKYTDLVACDVKL